MIIKMVISRSNNRSVGNKNRIKEPSLQVEINRLSKRLKQLKNEYAL